ncbi:MAG: hypothetical protein IJS78_07170 [Clostridia bacterium]|nr:hypothetical protein [Clostridia bacterium]
MEGIFKKSAFKYLFCLFFIVGGTFIAVRFALWGIDSIREGRIAETVFSFFLAVFGLCFGLTSIFIFSVNRKAYLKVDREKIDARFGLDQELHADVSSIENAEIKNGMLRLRTVEGGDFLISELVNVKDICEYILKITEEFKRPLNIDDAISNLKKSKKRMIRFLIPTVLTGLLMFINIALCVLATGGRDIGEFSRSDSITFAAFMFFEVVIIILCFLFADRLGKRLNEYNYRKSVLSSAEASGRARDGMEKYPDDARVRFFDKYSYRIVSFSVPGGGAAFMLERYDLKTHEWKPCFSGPEVFDSLSELNEMLKIRYSDVKFDE